MLLGILANSFSTDTVVRRVGPLLPELRWTAINLFANNELEESGIEESVEKLLALCKKMRPTIIGYGR